jgi:DNA helicase II / ATP-dependent DNA helicase PcrA
MECQSIPCKALIVPQRFYVHQQSRSGDRHLYASRTRFVPDALLALFEQRTWPVRTQEPGRAAGARVDIAARLRARWR